MTSLLSKKEEDEEDCDFSKTMSQAHHLCHTVIQQPIRNISMQ
uniref:Uncharacterized protein n=1 Tax=Arundo donax TaxID=35708 RepID=A0A0A9A7X1_ARUDO